MKDTTIKVKEDILNRINLYKYKWKLKNHDQVIRRLFEICSKIETADKLNAHSSKNSSTTSFLKLGGSKTTTSNSGANDQEERK